MLKVISEGCTMLVVKGNQSAHIPVRVATHKKNVHRNAQKMGVFGIKDRMITDLPTGA